MTCLSLLLVCTLSQVGSGFVPTPSQQFRNSFVPTPGESFRSPIDRSNPAMVNRNPAVNAQLRQWQAEDQSSAARNRYYQGMSNYPLTYPLTYPRYYNYRSRFRR